jgi:hypothetical protein
MFFMFGLYTRTAADEVLQTTGLETDYVEALLLVEAGLGAVEVVDSLGGGFHADGLIQVFTITLAFRNIIVIVEMIGNLKVKVRSKEEQPRRIRT